MNIGFSSLFAGVVTVLLVMGCTATQSAGISVDAGKQGPGISPMMYGIFFEEINHAGDGGLWAEMIRNRSFEDSPAPDGWQTVGKGGDTAIDDAMPFSSLNTHSLRITARQPGFGVANPGYWRLPLVKGRKYECTIIARSAEDFTGSLSVRLESKAGKTYTSKTIEKLTPQWRKFQFTLKPSESDRSALLSIIADKPGTFWLDFVSLVPSDAVNGFRPDLLAMLKELKPAFVRFPGGCYVEGGDWLADAWRWKLGLGPQETRRTHQCMWGYKTTNALGLHEYLTLCEMLGAEPLLVVNCGMAHKENAPMDKLDEWVQDALDAIEYANGDVHTTWGSKRAAAGHPKPFNLKYMEIGNENGGPAYEERYAVFYDAIKKRYPKMHLIADIPVQGHPCEIADDHYYSSPQFFVNAASIYDSYKRGANKVYVGEYAVTADCGHGNLKAALAEASFMMGMERNADVVTMASYAPLFVNENDRAWNPDMIPFDADTSYGTPSYYVQKLFAHNRGDVVLATSAAGPMQSSTSKGGIGVGTWLTAAEFADIKVTQGTLPDLKDWKKGQGDWSVTDGVLRQADLGENRTCTAFNADWQDYTLMLRARKLSGSEGFLIMFRARDEGNWFWWNIGGWGNVWSALERCDSGGKGMASERIPLVVETGRWYDIKVELSGPRVRCFLDGKLIHDVTIADVSLISAIATRENASGDVVLKVVNRSDSRWVAPIEMQNLGWPAAKARVTVLTSGSPNDENSLAELRKVHPVEQSLGAVRFPFMHTFSPYSLSILRFSRADR